MTDVFVVGAATTRHGDSGRSTADLAYHAAIAAMADAGIGDRDIPAAFVGSGGNGAPPTADSVAVRLGLRRLGFEAGDADGERELPGRVEHVSTSGGEALHHGWKAIEMDAYDLVLCIAADSAAGAWPLENVLSVRATEARSYMSASGATVEHLARISAKNRGNGGRPVSVAQVLESEELAWPLTRLMVAPAGEGAAAVILASPRAADRLTRAAPRVRASLLVQPEGRRDGAGRAARLAYEASGLGPEDLDCAELEDVTAAAELAAYEDLQLAPRGQGPELIDSGFTALGGVLPVNTSGGLLSAGELPGASGLAQICQLARQLRGEAGAVQVAGARVGLAQSGGHAADGDGLVALTILTA